MDATHLIDNRDALCDTAAKETALACLEAGIHAAHPRAIIRDAISITDKTLRIANTAYDLTDYDDVIVVGGGNAAGHIANALERVLSTHIDRGAVVTDDPTDTDVIEVYEGDHPVPSKHGVTGTQRVLEYAETADSSTLVIAVITGGGSALMPAPAGDLSLSDLRTVTNALLESGATIREINAVRKHLSALKGGQLTRTAAPAHVVSLVFSDVVGNELDVIASGPTVPDTSTFADAHAVLERYEITAPERVRQRIAQGVDGKIVETPLEGDSVFDQCQNHIIANNTTALKAACEVAADRSYTPCLLSSRVRGEAHEVAKTHVGIAEEISATGNPVAPPAVIVSGGETTVTVCGDGRGGPNQEFALSAALTLDSPAITVASIDTDGIDGATDAAGAVVDAATVEDTDKARAALASNDAHSYLEKCECLITTGATGTNVNDLRVLVIV